MKWPLNTHTHTHTAGAGIGAKLVWLCRSTTGRSWSGSMVPPASRLGAVFFEWWIRVIANGYDRRASSVRTPGKENDAGYCSTTQGTVALLLL